MKKSGFLSQHIWRVSTQSNKMNKILRTAYKSTQAVSSFSTGLETHLPSFCWDLLQKSIRPSWAAPTCVGWWPAKCARGEPAATGSQRCSHTNLEVRDVPSMIWRCIKTPPIISQFFPYQQTKQNQANPNRNRTSCHFCWILPPGILLVLNPAISAGSYHQVSY